MESARSIASDDCKRRVRRRKKLKTKSALLLFLDTRMCLRTNLLQVVQVSHRMTKATKKLKSMSLHRKNSR